MTRAILIEEKYVLFESKYSNMDTVQFCFVSPFHMKVFFPYKFVNDFCRRGFVSYVPLYTIQL